MDALKDKKAGDTVAFGENKFSAKILEIYAIVEPKAEETPAAQAEASPAAEAAPAAEVAPSDPATEAASGPANSALDLPAESPVPEFVPSDMGAGQAAASGN